MSLFLFLLVSGVGCDFCLWLFLDFSVYLFEGHTLRWIRSFLIGISQTVVLEGVGSEELSGVPQGSLLGPILFLLYINDLPDDIKSQVLIFADDTAVYLTLDKQNSSQQLQGDLDQLQKWEMELNPSKCVVMHITRSIRPTNSQYTMHLRHC